MGKTRSKKMVAKGDGGSRMRELDLVKQRLKLNIIVVNVLEAIFKQMFLK